MFRLLAALPQGISFKINFKLLNQTLLLPGKKLGISPVCYLFFLFVITYISTNYTKVTK